MNNKAIFLIVFYCFMFQICGAQLSIDWANNYGSDGNEMAFAIEQTSDDGYVIAGTQENGSDFDLWVSKLNENGKWEAPTFMEFLNSKCDDFGITFLNQESGYLSSKRNGHDNIFYFEQEK